MGRALREGLAGGTGDPAKEDARRSTAGEKLGGGETTNPGNRKDNFGAPAESSGGEAGAADRIEDVRFQIFEDYERLIIGFGGRTGAAGVPRWTVESPEEGGYVRIRFPGIVSTGVGHRDFVGSVLGELYVVRDRGGGLFIDVFGTHGFRHRVMEDAEAGRLIVDFRGVREARGLPPTTGDRAVVLQPREAEEVVSPLNVRGYAHFGGRVTVSLLSREREILASKTVRASNQATAWSPYETTIRFSDYEDLATLRVNGPSPEDDPVVGTETEVFLETSGPG